MNRFLFTEEEVKQAIQYIKMGKLPDYENSRLYRFKSKYEGFELKDDKLFKDGKEVVPQEKINEVLSSLYNNAETSLNGRDRFYQRVAELYIGISRAQVHEFLKNQETYQLHLRPTRVKIVNPIVSYAPYNIFQADLIELSDFKVLNNGYEYVLVVIDVYSKFMWVAPLKNKSASTVTKAFEEIIKESPPKTLQTDRGSEFLNSDFQAMLKKYDITHVASAPYNPKQQAVVERSNQTLKHLIYAHMTQFNTKRWVDVLPTLVNNYNNTYHTSTKYKALWSNEIYKVESVAYSAIGGLHKYRLEGMNQLFSRDRLQKVDLDKLQKTEIERPKYGSLPNIEKNIKSARSKARLFTPPSDTLIEGRGKRGQNKYEIEKITAKIVENGKTLYKVRWKGYAKATWEPYSTVRNTKAYSDFLKQSKG